ncbi:SDR family NAD(P)-dependent oxidoreductase [Niveibacterium sp. SC-1]|uniref:SDR family NAD(P)-dependent oxidoreductase n=1 Tax=Niveibacterium sp. SC-1 TaxID=3135646 RepID=UPI00311E5A09
MSLNKPIRDWRGKRVWIIGASNGVGAALARALAARGATLALSARNPERLAAVSAGIPGSLALPLDVTKAHTLMPALMQLLDQWSGLDMVILNAGNYEPMSAADLSVESARATVETHLMGVINMVAVVLPQLLQQGEGALTLIGDAAGYRGRPRALAYGASKAAVINLAEALYLDLSPRGIGVFLVNPGLPSAPAASRRAVSPEASGAADAANDILQGMMRGRFEIHFPRRSTYLLKLLRVTPEWLYLRVARALN